MTHQLLDRVTPDGVLLAGPDLDYDSDEVRALRRGGIHGSDVPAILGVTKYGSARSVWHAKHDGVDADEPGEAGRWGKLHEPTVADEWQRRRELPTLSLVNVGTLVHVDQPWMRAQVDRLLYFCPDMDEASLEAHLALDGGRTPTCSLEIKCRTAYVASRWVDDIPDDVLAQVAWQRMVTGLDHVHIACLIDGNRLVEHRYDRDDDLESLLTVECGALWDRVQAHDPPDLVYDEVIRDLLARLFPDRAGQRELTPAEYGELLGPWQTWKQAKAVAGELGAIARGKVLEALGSAEVLTYQGKAVFTYKQVDATEVDAYTRKAYRSLVGPR